MIPSAQSCLLLLFLYSFTFSHTSFLYSLFLLFVYKYLPFYFLLHRFRNCIHAKYFFHELELENDCGAFKTSFVFLIACFYNKTIASINSFQFQSIVISTLFLSWRNYILNRFPVLYQHPSVVNAIILSERKVYA